MHLSRYENRQDERLMYFAGYEEPEKFGIVEVPLPKLRENDILVCWEHLDRVKRKLTGAHS